jgi:hypothetical protein
MENADAKMDRLRVEASKAPTIRPYEPPSIRVLDEREILSAFQVTVATLSGG